MGEIAASGQQGPAGRYLLYGSEVYALAILRPLQAAIRARGAEVAWFFDGPGAEFLGAGERLLGSVREIRAFAPDVVLVPGNHVPGFIPGLKVELFHGFSVAKRDEGKGHFRIRGYFDLYCTQGPATTKRFEELAREHGYFDVIETGWPKMDPLFTKGEAAVPPDSRPTVLLTSTFTPRLSAARPLFETVRALAATRRWRWLANFHPKIDPATADLYRALPDEDLLYLETDDVIPLLRAADVMVSDTSSIASEFSLLQRPVVTFRRRVPEPHMYDVTETEELEAAIEAAIEAPPELMQKIRAYSDQVHPYRDGRSSERVLDAVDAVLSGKRPRRKKKPLNLWRNLQLRRELFSST